MILYEMLVGKSPFFNKDIHKMLENIRSKAIHYTSKVSPDARSFIEDILARNPKKRLGYGKDGIEDIKNHTFFRGIDWKRLRIKDVSVPFKPKIKSEESSDNFDQVFTKELVVDTPAESGLDDAI